MSVVLAVAVSAGLGGRDGGGEEEGAALVSGDTLTFASVGDSRMYLVNDHAIAQLTEDDSWLSALKAQEPNIDASQLERHPLRHVITKAIGTLTDLSRGIYPPLLAERGLFESRSRAAAAVIAGDVRVGGRPASKPGELVADEAEVYRSSGEPAQRESGRRGPVELVAE